MKKVYKASNYLSVPIVSGGKIIGYADFTDERFTYVTEDASIQSALEGLPCFGTLFTLSQVVGESSKKKGGRKLKTYAEVEDWQDAAALLVTAHGLSAEGLDTPAAIVKGAEKAGVVFPKLQL